MLTGKKAVPKALEDPKRTVEELRKLAVAQVENIGMGFPKDEGVREVLAKLSSSAVPHHPGETEHLCFGCGELLLVGPNVLAKCEVVLCVWCVAMCERLGATLDVKVAPEKGEGVQVGGRH